MSDDKNFDRLTLENALAELGRRAFAAGFYPQNMLQPKTRLGLEEIFSNLEIDPDKDQTSSSSSQP